MRRSFLCEREDCRACVRGREQRWLRACSIVVLLPTRSGLQLLQSHPSNQCAHLVTRCDASCRSCVLRYECDNRTCERATMTTEQEQHASPVNEVALKQQLSFSATISGRKPHPRPLRFGSSGDIAAALQDFPGSALYLATRAERINLIWLSDAERLSAKPYTWRVPREVLESRFFWFSRGLHESSATT